MNNFSQLYPSIKQFFHPQPSRSLLVSLVSWSSLQSDILMPGLVQMSNRHRTTYNRISELKLVTQSSLQIAGLQEYATTPSNQSIGLMVIVFTNGPGDCGSIPGLVIPKTQKMVLDTSLLNTHHYKVCIKGKLKQSKEWSSTFPYTLV